MLQHRQTLTIRAGVDFQDVLVMKDGRGTEPDSDVCVCHVVEA